MSTRAAALLCTLPLALVATACAASSEPSTSDRPRSGRSASSAVPSDGAASPTPSRSAPAQQPTASISVPAELRSIAPDREIEGADMSWPQCPRGTGIPQKQGQGATYPLPSARYVVLGLTNGPGFTPNPCLADQVAWVEQHHLQAAAYSVVSYPDAAMRARSTGLDDGPYDAGTRLGRLRNAGYAQARFNLTTMDRVGLTSPIVWIDVEPVPGFDWPAETTGNAAVVTGAVRGYRDAGLGVGFYSTPVLWQHVVGDLRLGLPEWRAAGETSRAEACRRCGADWSFGTGSAALSQWLENGRDHDITCPGTSVRMAIWFHQY